MARVRRLAVFFALVAVILMLASSAAVLAPGAGGASKVPEAGSARAPMYFADYEVEYALITNEAQAASFQPLIEWKIQKGLRAKLYTVDGTNGIYQTYINGDNARRIHDFLADLDSNSGSLQYVCLGGDFEVIPSRHMYAGALTAYKNTEWEDYYYSDYYYAGLDSSWDADGDGRYGEPGNDGAPGEEDVTPEVYVGRLPSKTPGEATLMVNRIVRYESNITDGDWLSRGFFGASLMDRPNVPDDPLTNLTDEGYNIYKDNAYEGLQGTLAYVPGDVAKVILYDYNQLNGGNYSLANDTLTPAAFKTEMNKGYAVIDYLGQAFFGGNELAHYDNKTGTGTGYQGFKPLYSYSDAKAQSNGNMAGLVILATCDSGNFTETDDTNMETFLKAPNGGAVGLIASSGRSYRGETDDDHSFGNWWFNKFLVKKLYEGDTVQGRLLYDLKVDYYTSVYPDSPLPRCVMGNVYGYNLLGDPETDIYTGRAGTFTVQTSPLYTGSNAVTVTVKDASGDPVQGARAALTGLGVLAANSTDATGRTVLYFTTGSTGQMDITVTKHNFKAHLGKVQVVERPLDLETGNALMRLGAPFTVPGRMVEVNITVQNNADVDLSGVKAVLSDSYQSSGSQVRSDLKEFTVDIPAASSRYLVHTFNTTVAGDHTLTLTLDPLNAITESDEENNVAKAVLHVDHPPVFSKLPEIRLQEDEVLINGLSLLGEKLVSDPDNQTYELAFSLIENRNMSCFVTVTSSGDVSVIPEPDWNGRTDVRLAVSDGMLSVEQHLVVKVDPLPDAPVIERAGDQTAYMDELFTLYISAADPDKGEVLTYSDDSDFIDINASSGAISFIPYEEHKGVYQITVTASDPTGLSSSITFNLTVKEDDRPRIEARTFKLTEGKRFETAIQVKNPLAGHTYTYSDNTDLFDIEPATGSIEFKPTAEQVGSHSVKITATDTSDGSVIHGVITLEVKEAGDSSMNSAVLIALLIIVLIGMFIVIFYFFILPNIKKEEPEDLEEEQVDRRGRRGPGPRTRGGPADDENGKPGTGKGRRPERRSGSGGKRPGKEGDAQAEEEKGSKGLLGGLLKKEEDKDPAGRTGRPGREERMGSGKKPGRKDPDPPVVTPRRVKAPRGAKKPEKDPDDD